MSDRLECFVSDKLGLTSLVHALSYLSSSIMGRNERHNACYVRGRHTDQQPSVTATTTRTAASATYNRREALKYATVVPAWTLLISLRATISLEATTTQVWINSRIGRCKVTSAAKTTPTRRGGSSMRVRASSNSGINLTFTDDM